MRDIYKLIGGVLVIIVAVLGTAAILHMAMSLPFEATSSSDKRAEWIGAFGTVGALIGTIWIATGAQRREYAAQLALATISAATFTRSIPDLISTLEVVIDRLADDEGQILSYLYHNLAETVAGPPTWSNADLATIIILPNRAAAKLAIAKVDIEKLATDFHNASELCRMGQYLDSDQFESDMQSRARVLLRQLTEGQAECLAVLGHR